MKLNEKLGVPEGINKQASKLYNELINDLESYQKGDKGLPTLSDYGDDGDTAMLIGRYDLQINDLKLDEVPFLLRFYYVEDIPEPELMAASYGNKHGFTKDKDNIKLKQNYKDSFFLLKVVVGKTSTKDSLISKIKRDLKPDTIAHELMHLYDNFKKGKSSVEDTAEYNSYQKGGFPPIISDFLHLLYYMTSIENIVRPSELYQSLLDNMVSKSNFKDFVEQTKIMKNIRKAENFSLSKFKEELESDIEVNRMVSQAIDNGYQSVGSVSDDALNLLMINIASGALDSTDSILKSYIAQSARSLNPLETLFALIGGNDSKEMREVEKLANKKFNQMLSKYQKYEKNPQKYFEYLEKKLNFVADKMKRKLYKLYDMVKDTTNKSIINWDLHNKINSKNEKLVYTLDFKSFKRK